MKNIFHKVFVILVISILLFSIYQAWQLKTGIQGVIDSVVKIVSHLLNVLNPFNFLKLLVEFFATLPDLFTYGFLTYFKALKDSISLIYFTGEPNMDSGFSAPKQ